MSLTVVADGPCRALMLDRPQAANALSADLVERLTDAVTDAHASGAEVLVLRGNGRHFCGGFDFVGIEQASEAELLQRFIRIELLLQMITQSPCLTIALAHGSTYGAGADLFAACQWRIAAGATRFRFPGLAFGIVLGTARLGSLIGRERARTLLGSLRAIEAPEALALGLVTRIAEQEDWDSVRRQALDESRRLPLGTRRALGEALARDDYDQRLAKLVRSAAEPGLKDRMMRYWGGQREGQR